MKYILIIIIAVGLSNKALSSEISTPASKIKKLLIDGKRPSNVGLQDSTYIKLESMPEITGCSSAFYYVKNESTALISSLLAAHMAKLDVTLVVEQNPSHAINGTCLAVEMHI
ncbi:MAG: hypothetical protein K6L81_14670 [Agarilytica sp.]